jgi:eukaryotic-like serine/threonine-protein kinase
MESAVGPYNLLELLGEGGLGPVYRARDTRFGRTVALKVIPPAQLPAGPARVRFVETARAAAGLSHPNIATLFDVGEHEGGLYLAYEFARGITVREEIAGHAVAPRRALDIAVQIADALADGHASGIIHGDVRPDNVVITPKGSAKLLEFGLSEWSRAGRLRRRAAASPQALTYEALPIVSYMSPEQALGGAVDARTDVFSLGIILYEMLTGTHPFAAGGAESTIVNIIQARPAPMSSIAKGAPVELDAIVARALAKDIEARQQSAAALSAELRGVSAMLDVRSGDAADAAPLIPDDEGIGAGTWIAILIALAAVGAAIWYWVG